MRLTENKRLKKNIVEIICLLYILLFAYAAVSKLLDYHDFSIKLGQSPMFSVFTDYVAIGVPVVELMIVVMLCFQSWRITGLFASFCLMLTFTAYIFILLNFSSYVRCSCGGVLQDLGWMDHLFLI